MNTLFNTTTDNPEIDFPTDYTEIINRMEHIQPIQYAKTRNYIHGAVTYLSPYISRGVISVKQVQDSVMNKGFKAEQIEKFLQELAWREYYQRIWQAKTDLIWQDLKQPQPDILHRKMISAAANAATGITAIDRQIDNLFNTGYMHNHTRMYLASILCNIGKAHWLLPSKWMYHHLLDGDIASNNCSWQWVSGAFASKKYYCNQENINKYSNTDQRQTFLDSPYEAIPHLPVPEVLKETFVPDLQTILPVTALPNLDISKPTLIYNSYNLDPEWRKNENVNRVLLLEPAHFRQYPLSNKVVSFIIGLAKNIAGIQVYCGEVDTLQDLYKTSTIPEHEAFISKEHPAFRHYPGIKDNREWMYPEVTGFYPSFFGYWKKVQKSRGRLFDH